MEKIISRCLRKDQERRPQHAGDIKLALEELREDSASGKLSSAAKPAEQAPARSSLRLVAIVAGAAVLLAAIGALWWLKRSAAAPARTDWCRSRISRIRSASRWSVLSRLSRRGEIFEVGFGVAVGIGDGGNGRFCRAKVGDHFGNS